MAFGGALAASDRRYRGARKEAGTKTDATAGTMPVAAA